MGGAKVSDKILLIEKLLDEPKAESQEQKPMPKWLEERRKKK